SKNFSADVRIDPEPLIINVLYFAICEAIWQTTIGKRICGLRVVSTSGELTWRQAAARALIFYGADVPLVLVGLVVSRGRLVDYLSRHVGVAMVSSFGPLVFMVLLFAFMRRKNGLAALHDLWTGTRVVQRTSRELRRSAAPVAGAPADAV